MNNIRNEDLLRLFGMHLAELRRERLQTQKSLAFRSNIEISQISRIERGLLNPTLSTLNVLAKSLEMTLPELCDFNLIDSDKDKS